jgi:hypothetical protein
MVKHNIRSHHFLLPSDIFQQFASTGTFFFGIIEYSVRLVLTVVLTIHIDAMNMNNTHV